MCEIQNYSEKARLNSAGEIRIWFLLHRAYIEKDDYTVGHLSNMETSRKQSLRCSTCLNEAL